MYSPVNDTVQHLTGEFVMTATSLNENKTFKIGILGDKASLIPFWEMFINHGNSRVLEEMGFIAATLPDPEPEQARFSAEMSLPIYPNYAEMLEKHPEINMLIEATGEESVLKGLRAALPPQITLVERSAASFFIKLLTSEQLWVACKLDLMHTQTMLKTIIDQLSEEILFLDAKGRIVDLNANASAKLGKSKKELVNADFYELYASNVAHPPASDGNGGVLEKAVNKGEASESTMSQVDEEGRVQYFRVYAYPIFGSDSKLTNIVVMRRDITQRTQIEQRLQQSEKLASIGELSTYIAHEIRNPLFAISGFTNSLLRNPDLDEKSREKLSIILSESKRLDNILKSILNFSRPTEASSGTVDVNQAVGQTMKIMSFGCDNHGITVHTDLTSGLAKAQADTETVKQSLINMVKNSIEAMPDGGELYVRTGMTRDYVFLQVQDTGKGIPIDIRDKVFSPFFSTKGKGSGLGLAMIKKIVDDIGGKVDLSSKEGEGTTITMYLPPILAVAETGSVE